MQCLVLLHTTHGKFYVYVFFPSPSSPGFETVHKSVVLPEYSAHVLCAKLFPAQRSACVVSERKWDDNYPVRVGLACGASVGFGAEQSVVTFCVAPVAPVIWRCVAFFCCTKELEKASFANVNVLLQRASSWPRYRAVRRYVCVAAGPAGSLWARKKKLLEDDHRHTYRHVCGFFLS